jgi:hypothetical protein
MVSFTEYIRQRLENSGYKFIKKFANFDLFMCSPDDKLVWICYLEVGIEPEQIRRLFDFDGHVLIVVNEKLIPQEIVSRTETPMWLRVLHGLYMGRVYVWNDRYLFGLHFDYDTGDISESGIIQPDDLLLVETGTWLRGWTGVYRLARFYDRQWWNEPASSGYAGGRDNYQSKTDWGDPYKTAREKQQSSSRQSYEQARDSYWEQQKAREQSDGYADWQERMRQQQAEWERQQARYGTGQNQTYDTPWAKPPKSDGKVKRDFMREFAQAGSPSAVKALFRKLAKEFHPDLNPGVDTTEIMQQVNAAYEKWK